jgi:phosphoribosyl 1,2-cyclic phosphodiesterase
MKLNLCILRSGSHANCTAIWTEDECILIDCSRIEKIPEELRDIGIKPSHIKALLITHAHGDHIDDKALKFMIAHRIPLYSHPLTFERIQKKFPRIKYDIPLMRDISSGPVSIGKFQVESFGLDHWADRLHVVGHPLGFTLMIKDNSGKHKIGFVTDTKVITPAMHEFLKDCQSLIIEANYSEEYIKTINPHVGYEEHLGNKATGKAILKIRSGSKERNILKKVFLAHISDSNNTVERALEEVNAVISHKHPDIELYPSYRHEKTDIHELG